MFNMFSKIFWVLFLFSLTCSACDDEQTKRTAAVATDPNLTVAPDGMAIFRQKCVICHGADGTLGLNGAKDLSQSVLPIEERINTITNGRKLMTPFGTILTPDEIKAVATYTQTLKK